MHRVDRGPEPAGLRRYRRKNTPRWIAYYQDNTGNKPTDSHWRKFVNHLSNAFHNLCGYCEEECRGETDHFYPKSRFPQKVYEWTNWVFSCHDCNLSKREKCPTSGYVNPCAENHSEHPERFFDFDFKTGLILPKENLDPRRKNIAEDSIRDLELNAFHHVKRRITWIYLVSKAFESLEQTDNRRSLLIEEFTSRSYALSSFALAYFSSVTHM